MAAASFVVAAPRLPPPGNQQEMGGSGTTTRAGPFDACVWGDFFVTYVPPPSQACMRAAYIIFIYTMIDTT